jgi:hypothetical protein
MTIGLSTTVRTNRSTQINTAAGASAIITLYTGTRPATGGTVTTALGTVTGNSGGFGTVSNGVLTASAITNGTATATGTATWARLTSSGGTFVADMDVSVTGGAGDLQLGTVSIVANAILSVTSCVLTEGNA